MRRGILVFAVSAGALLAQRGGGDWSTGGFDAQRSSWVRGDAKISKASMQKPGFRFLWKLKLGAEQRQGGSPAGPVLIGQYIGYRGFRSFAYFGGAGDGIYALEADLGRVEWSKMFPGQPSPSGGCGGGVLVTRPTTVAIAPPGRGGFGGRSTFAKSSVGDPGEGAPIIKELAAAAAGGGRGGRGFVVRTDAERRAANRVFALSPDGMLHGLYLASGEEPDGPIHFL